MKEFSYSSVYNWNLNISYYNWLKGIGLRETCWIVDIKWFARHSEERSFDEWIHE